MLLAILLITAAQTSKTYAQDNLSDSKNEIGINLNSPILFFINPGNSSMFLGELQYKRSIGEDYFCRTKLSYRRSNQLATNRLSTYGVIDNEKIRYKDATNYYKYLNNYNEQIVSIGTGIEKRKNINQYLTAFYGLDMELSKFESKVQTYEALLSDTVNATSNMVMYHDSYFPTSNNRTEVTTATTKGILIAPVLFYGLIANLSEKISVAANVQTNSYFYIGKLKHENLKTAINNTIKITSFDYSLGGSINIFYRF